MNKKGNAEKFTWKQVNVEAKIGRCPQMEAQNIQEKVKEAIKLHETKKEIEIKEGNSYISDVTRGKEAVNQMGKESWEKT